MSWRLFFLILSFTASAVPATPLAGSPKSTNRIIWYKPNWPPYFIPSGTQAGQGRMDHLLDYLQSSLQLMDPDLQFDSNYYALSSLEQMRLQRPNTCNVSHLRTPRREKFAYFTAFYIQPPPQLVFREEDWRSKLYEARVISFARLLNEKNLRGGFSADRSYGPALDSLIQSYRKSSSVELIPGIPDSSSLLNMLAAKKFDFSLEYEEVARHLIKSNLVLGHFAFAEAEEQRNLVVVHIACSRTEWGRRTILKIDSALQKLATTDKFKNLMESWHSQDILQSHRKEFDEFYRKRAEGPWTNALPNPSDQK